MFCATQNLWAMKSGCLAKAISKQCWRSSLVLYCFQWNTRKNKLFHTIFIHMHTQVGNSSDKRRRRSCHLQQHGWTLRALRARFMGSQRVGHDWATDLILSDLNACVLSYVWAFATPRTVAHQAPLFMGFSWQEYWSGLPFPTPGDLPDPGIETASLSSPALAGRFFTTRATWEAPLKGIMLSETSQTERYKYCVNSLTYGILKNKKKQNETQTHRFQEQIGGYQISLFIKM